MRACLAKAHATRKRVLLRRGSNSLEWNDVTVQARILELIAKLRRERGLAYVLISHNLAVVEQLCEETTVLYLGRIVEHGPTEEILAHPAHPYTLALRSAVPEIDLAARRSRIVLPGSVPDRRTRLPGALPPTVPVRERTLTHRGARTEGRGIPQNRSVSRRRGDPRRRDMSPSSARSRMSIRTALVCVAAR